MLLFFINIFFNISVPLTEMPDFEHKTTPENSTRDTIEPQPLTKHQKLLTTVQERERETIQSNIPWIPGIARGKNATPLLLKKANPKKDTQYAKILSMLKKQKKKRKNPPKSKHSSRMDK